MSEATPDPTSDTSAPTPRIIIEGYSVEQGTAITAALTSQQTTAAAPAGLVDWLKEQEADGELEQSMFTGPLGRSPFHNLMSELIRRAGG